MPVPGCSLVFIFVMLWVPPVLACNDPFIDILVPLWNLIMHFSISISSPAPKLCITILHFTITILKIVNRGSALQCKKPMPEVGHFSQTLSVVIGGGVLLRRNVENSNYERAEGASSNYERAEGAYGAS